MGKDSHQSGFTFPEIIVVSGIILILFGLITVRLLGVQHKPQLSTTVATLITDLKQQQIKVMSGDSQGTGTLSSFGVYLEPTRYILFRGTAYSSSDPANLVIALEPSLRIGTTLPASTMVFTKGSGEVANFIAGANTITVQNTESGESQIMEINQLGVVAGIQ